MTFSATVLARMTIGRTTELTRVVSGDMTFDTNAFARITVGGVEFRRMMLS
jgi:hypothetical protein